jgi:hypothetical protein
VAFVGLFVAIWIAYAAPGIRLKHLPLVPYAVEGLAAATCLLYGVHYGGGGPEASGAAFPFAIAAFLGFAIASPVKDVKDYGADGAGGIPTVFVLAGADPGPRGGWPRLVTALVVLGTLLVPAVWLLVVTGGGAVPAAGALGAVAVVAAVAVAGLRSSDTAVQVCLLAVSVHLFLAAALTPPLLAAG